MRSAALVGAPGQQLLVGLEPRGRPDARREETGTARRPGLLLRPVGGHEHSVVGPVALRPLTVLAELVEVLMAISATTRIEGRHTEYRTQR